ncbi:MAG: flagellar basal-body rod protein FlgG [Micavibrio sp.]|nr:flagellar basal-body rod protein FlgG [Micavibrio sp.]HCK32136.1 flagellar basal-body rod protein FlgG [Rhodospirillaceae bacterium]|tara:strand:- start:1183 stop:1968 length:786 start_codon:yes stop_codon:yes gene_type:complete
MLSLNIGASGMLAQQLNVDVISNNLANMTTTGYKRQRAQFQDLMYQNIERPGATSSDVGTIVPSGIQLGLGVKAASVHRLHSQGSAIITDNEFDVAIMGEGYFQIELPSGETAYTRDGSFQVNGDGEIVTSNGYVVEPTIVVPDDAISIVINNSGEVLAQIDGQADMTNLGQLELSVFANKAGLEAVGQNLFLETEASGAPIAGNPNADGFGRIEQGVLEAANVNSVEEITNLITAQRAYEFNSQIVQVSDQMLEAASNLR